MAGVHGPGGVAAVKVHTLKTWRPHFDAVERGEKPFEVRLDDRGFEMGDLVVLLRWDEEEGRPEPGQGPPTLLRRITCKLDGGQFGIEPGYCVLGLEEV